MSILRRQRSVLPGFGLALGFALTYLSLLVLIPLAGLFVKSASLGPAELLAAVGSPRALAAYRLSFGASLAAATLNAGLGLVTAWVLVRYRFPGRGVLDALVDLPFALPTAVAGITLTALLARNGWIGRHLGPLGVEVAYTPLGIVVALTFIGLPFVVRTLQPVLQDLEPELERAMRGAAGLPQLLALGEPGVARALEELGGRLPGAPPSAVALGAGARPPGPSPRAPPGRGGRRLQG